MRLFLVLLLACNAYGTQILVGAAADLTRVGPVLAEAYRKTTAVEVRFSFAASGVLSQQIEHGAPYDIFLSADQAYVTTGIGKGYLLKGTADVYALGELAIWSRSGSYRRLEDLTKRTVLHLAIANPTHAPYGAAAAQALKNSGLWDRLQGRIVYGENIRQTLQYAESGNADAAIVSRSLVFDRGAFPVPRDLYKPIRQSAAVVTSSGLRHEAQRFLRFLTSPEGQRILQQYGFQHQ